MGCFFMFTQSPPIFAAPKADENKVVIREPTSDVNTLYKNYKDNSFELMTEEKEKKSALGVKEAMTNSSAILKNFTWSGVKGLGQFNSEMVKFLFSMDVVTPIKEPMLKLTANIAENMLSIAGTIGISFVTLIMVFKFIGEQRFRQALRVFLMTILIFTGLAVCKDAGTSNSLFNNLFEIDKQIEAKVVDINPILGGQSVPESKDKNVAGRMKNAGDMIATRVFYTNVYEPYLLMNYGTTNTEKIRKKKVEYKDTKYDRINILLDNDVTSEENDKLHEEVTKYEAEDIKNRNIMYYKNLQNTFYGAFYFVVNLLQGIVYFVLCFLRLVISVMQLLLVPLLPILLLAGLFMAGMNVFVNYFKAFGMTIFMKAMAGFACIIFATFLSLGFQLSNAVDNIWQKILTILIYLLTPLGIYFFRKFLGGLFVGRVSLADAVNFATHPFSTEKKMRDAAKAKKAENRERVKQAKEERKEANKKRQEEATKRGKTELGLKQKPIKEQETKRSALRRELKPKMQHKEQNKAEKVQQSVQNLHEKGRQQEAKEHQEIAQKRQRKDYDKENLKTAAALSTANQAMRSSNFGSRKTDPKSHQSGSQLRENTRRTGQSSIPKTNGQRSTARHQGDRQVPATKQRQASGERSVARNQYRRSGQKPVNAVITPKTTGQSRGRIPGGNGGSPLRHTASVRQKMQAVQQVIHQQPGAVQAAVERESPAVAKSPITRVAKRNAPPVRAMKGSAIRRSIKSPTNSAKGMKRPNARK